MDEKVAGYLKRQKAGQGEVCVELRKIILANFPRIKETVMTEGLWYEGKFYITAFKDHVNLGVGVGGLSEEELKNFQGKGKSMRHLKFFSVKEIDESALVRLMKIVYDKSACSCRVNWRGKTVI